MTTDEALTYVQHDSWPDGSPCRCEYCIEARSIRGWLAAETRNVAVHRGYPQRIADRAACFRLNPDMDLDKAIEMALERENL